MYDYIKNLTLMFNTKGHQFNPNATMAKTDNLKETEDTATLSDAGYDTT